MSSTSILEYQKKGTSRRLRGKPTANICKSSREAIKPRRLELGTVLYHTHTHTHTHTHPTTRIMEAAGTKTRTILWCAPRSGSTALAKCLTAVQGMELWFESFCFCLVARVESERHLDMDLPVDFKGNEERFRKVADLLGELSPCNFKPDHFSYTAIQKMLERTAGQHVFVKDMAYAMPKSHYGLLPAGFQHTFLIRHPRRVFHSNRKAMIKHLSEQDLLDGDADDFDLEKDDPLMTPGLMYKEIYDLWQFVRANVHSDPIIIDGDDLLSKPDEILPKYCRAIGIPYNESLLRWDSSSDVTKRWKTPVGPDDDLQTTFMSFFQTSMNSSSFFPPSKMPSLEEVSADVIRCTDEVMGYYSEMYEARLRP